METELNPDLLFNDIVDSLLYLEQGGHGPTRTEQVRDETADKLIALASHISAGGSIPNVRACFDLFFGEELADALEGMLDSHSDRRCWCEPSANGETLRCQRCTGLAVIANFRPPHAAPIG